MKNIKLTRSLILLGACILLVGISSEAFAGPKRHDRKRDERRTRVVVKHPSPRIGAPVKQLPGRHTRVVVGKKRYYSHRGVFYRKRPSGFVVARAPIGAVLASIPSGHISFRIGSIPYFFFGGVLYRRAPRGYVVVEAPSQTVITEEPAWDDDRPLYGDHVAVAVSVLNVRSGPGKGYSVIRKVRRGSDLIVRGNAPGWIYVELPGGRMGWVMSRYTSYFMEPANG